MKILSKGSEISFVHESVGWDESINFKDFDVVFVDLQAFEESAGSFDHPYNESEDSPKLFDTSDVSTFLKTGGFMFVYLPSSSTVDMGQPTTETPNQAMRPGRGAKETETEPYLDYNLFDWLPFSVDLSTDEKGDSVDCVDSDWGFF